MQQGWGTSISQYFKFAIIALFFIGAFLYSIPRAQASASHLVINEICSVPISGQKEWVEIYNPTATTISLSDYSLKDGAVAAKSLSGSIPPLSYYVFEASSGWLNNSGEVLNLILVSSAEVIDSIIYGDWGDEQDSQPQAPALGYTLSRIPNGVDTDDYMFDFRVLSPSKGTLNTLPSYPAEVELSEVLPSPDSAAEEYIELFNQGEVGVDLSAWQLDDVDGGSAPYLFPDGTTIAAKQYLIVPKSISNISLNDTGDSARLIDPNSEERSTISYDSSRRGESYAKFEHGWLWTILPTPGLENILKEAQIFYEEDSLPADLTIMEAKNSEIGTLVRVSGIVTSAPGKLSSQYFYIQDGTSGIQIYYYQADFPDLIAGSKVAVVGEVSETNGEKRIKIADISDIELLGNQSELEAISRDISEIGQDEIGVLIETIGIVTETSGSTFKISDDNSTLSVVIRETTGIVKPRMEKGDKVRIIGVISSYKGDLRILPFYQDGVTILTSGQLPVTGGSWQKEILWNLSAITQQRLLILLQVWLLAYVAGIYCVSKGNSAQVRLPRLNL